jgi:hypothetical protein
MRRLTSLVLLLLLPRLPAEDRAWLRTVDTPGEGRELQTALRRYDLPKHPGRSVTLLGVSHIGSRAYYEGIQERLDAAGLVLYEGIGGDRPEFRNATAADYKDAGLQADLAAALGLQFQLAAIRYNRPHFRNSDVGPVELLALFQGDDPDALDAESLEKLQALLAAMQNEGPLSQALSALLDQIGEHPGRARSLRWSLAEILGALDGDLSRSAAVPPDMRRLMEGLLQGRNNVVLRDLRALLANENGPKDIVIFYGAAHMHDLEVRLVEEFEAEPQPTEWLPAFRGSLRGSGLSAVETTALRWFTQEQVRVMKLLKATQPPSDK